MLQRVLRGADRLSANGEGVSPTLRRGAIISAAVHAAIILLLIVGLPFARPPEEPQETTVSMVFAGTAESSAKGSPTQEITPAPANTPQATQTSEAEQPPKPQPTEAAPPPPPPPPPPPQPPQSPAQTLPTPPTPTPPPTPSEAAEVAPPPPAAPPSPPQAQPPLPTPPLPVPPPPVPPPPSPQSATSQPNVTKNPAPESTALENTLEKLRSLQRQTQPPKARYNPPSTGAVGTGNPQSDSTSALSLTQRGAIGDYVRRCWSTDPGMLDLDRMQVLLTVTTDAGGVVRLAKVAPQDIGRVSGDPRLRVFSERAIRAVLDPNCANLPLPQTMLGQTRDFTFLFKP